MDSAPKAESAHRKDEDKQRRHYRVGLSYRCGRCGKPKKGHVCDQPDGEDGAPISDAPQLSPTPAILATTVRKGTPPALLGSLTKWWTCVAERPTDRIDGHIAACRLGDRSRLRLVCCRCAPACCLHSDGQRASAQ